MQRIVRLEGSDVEVVIRRHHFSRVLRLRIGRDGSVRVTIPIRASMRMAEAFVLGKRVWILQKLSEFRERGTLVPVHSEAEQAAYREQARRLAEERAKYFSGLLGVSFARITIRDQRTRWGSCSRTGNLCFNYRIALVPPHLADYVVVHELCHLREFNHSPAFWRLVESFIPQSKECRRALKRYFL